MLAWWSKAVMQYAVIQIFGCVKEIIAFADIRWISYTAEARPVMQYAVIQIFGCLRKELHLPILDEYPMYTVEARPIMQYAVIQISGY